MTTMPVTLQERIPLPVSHAGGPAAAGAGLSFGDVIRILKQRMFLILFVWVMIMGVTVGGTFYLLKKYPLFKAVALVFVESPLPKAPLQFVEPLVQVELMDRFVADQAVLVKDDRVLSEALQDHAVRDTDWFRVEEKNDDNRAIEDLKDDLAVKQVPSTSFLAVSFATKKPEDSAAIVNAVLDKYHGKVTSSREEALGSDLDAASKSENTLRDAVKRNETDQQELMTRDLGVPGITVGLNVVGETWRALQAEVTRLEAEKLQYRAAYENLMGVDPSQIAISPETRMMIEQEPEIGALRNALLSIEQSLSVRTAQGLGPGHREMLDLASQHEAADKLLRELRATKEQEVREYRINSAQTTYLNAMQAELQLQDRVQEAEAKQRDVDKTLAEYKRLVDEHLQLVEQLSRVRDYSGQLQMIKLAHGTIRVKVGQAVAPKERYFPRWEYHLPAGFVLGVLLGVGLAMLLELLDTSVKTTRDIIRHLRVPILGTVPDLDDEEVEIDRVELASHTAPRSMVAEAFRVIRTNLLLSSPAERQRSVLVTSAKPEEGKTAIAVNLAISIAQSGRRVLLVDANFHRPALHSLFPASRPEGLSNVLVGQARVTDLVCRTDLPNLDVLTSGPIPPNPTELLSGSYLREMIAQATERYDQIILDGPPILLVSDVLAMTGSVDGVVLVCRAKVASRGTVGRAREQLERVDAHVFGAVLNAAQVTRGGYFREQMRSYYEYQPQEALGADAQRVLPKTDEDRGSGDQ